MAHSYNRWKPCRPLSWPCKVYIRHREEHRRMIWSLHCASKYTFKMLGQTGALRTDLAQNHFATTSRSVTVQQWQDDFKQFLNWTNLNQLLAQSACFETYIASILKLVFDSDPGLIVGASHHIDGVRQLKLGTNIDNKITDMHLTNCTKGTWQSRISAITSLFGHTFNSLSNYCGDLEKLREIRNNVGHAFGRSINLSQNYGSPTMQPMTRVSERTVTKYFKIINEIVRELDLYLMLNHVGNFQEFHYLHNKFASLALSNESVFKSDLTAHAQEVYSLQFCKWVITYYKNL